MPTNGESFRKSPENEMLSDEQEVITERLDQLDDQESHLTINEVAADLGIELD